MSFRRSFWSSGTGLGTDREVRTVQQIGCAVWGRGAAGTVSRSAEAKWIREDFLEEVTQMLRPKRCVHECVWGAGLMRSVLGRENRPSGQREGSLGGRQGSRARKQLGMSDAR